MHRFYGINPWRDGNKGHDIGKVDCQLLHVPAGLLNLRFC